MLLNVGFCFLPCFGFQNWNTCSAQLAHNMHMVCLLMSTETGILIWNTFLVSLGMSFVLCQVYLQKVRNKLSSSKVLASKTAGMLCLKKSTCPP